MRSTLIGVALACCYVAASAEPLTIKDFVLGEELQAAAAKAKMSCSKVKGVPGLACFSLVREKPDLITTIAGVPAKSAILSGLDDGLLGSVRYVFAQSDFALVRSAFTARYPMVCTDSVVQNRMGAAFDQTVCVHETEDGSITLRRRNSDLSEGSVEVISSSYRAGVKAWYDQRKAERKKDI
jgi:hypothetical protein